MLNFLYTSTIQIILCSSNTYHISTLIRITLGNQLEGVRLKDPDIVKLFREKYPDGNCMGPPQSQKR